MLVPDSDIVGISHFPDESYYVHPECTSTDLNYYRIEGLTADTADEAITLFTEQARLTAEKGEKETEIRLTSKAEYSTAVSRLFEKNILKQFLHRLISSCGTNLKNAYKYNNDQPAYYTCFVYLQ
jgi:hypothetical protein